MGKLVVSEFVSLDGVMRGPGRRRRTMPTADGRSRSTAARTADRFKLDELMEADILLLGRRTYEGFAKAWPSMYPDESDSPRSSTACPRSWCPARWRAPTGTTRRSSRGDLAEGIARTEDAAPTATSSSTAAPSLCTG